MASNTFSIGGFSGVTGVTGITANTGASAPITVTGTSIPSPVSEQPDRVITDFGTPLGTDLYQINIQNLDIPAIYEFPAVVTTTSIEHIDTAESLLTRHLALFNSTRERLDDTKDSDSLNRRLQAFIDKWGDDSDVRTLLQPYLNGSETSGFNIKTRPTLTEATLMVATDNSSTALFKLGRNAMDDFHQLSGQQYALQRLRRIKAVAVRQSSQRSADLQRQIDNARRHYENLDKDRLSADEDYGLTRGLLEQQLLAVDDAFAERQRLLSNPVGLCYVRVNDLPADLSYQQTPLIAAPRPGELPIACANSTDTDTDNGLPQRLQPFLDLLSDQPMSAWRALQNDWQRLPREWIYQPPARALPTYAQRIATLPVAFHRLISALPVAVTASPQPADRRLSQAEAGRRAADRLSLDQLTGNRNPTLRRNARRLQDELGQALACVLQQLQRLPASLRFRWSRLAEDDHLDSGHPSRWPGFDSVQQHSAALTLRELIAWMQRQIADNADNDARTAMRTAIRACLLQSVNDDPADLLQGEVVQFPGDWQAGAMLSANLNQLPTLHAPLRIYDQQRRLIGDARVVDSSHAQAQIEILSTYVTTPITFSAWTVVGRNR